MADRNGPQRGLEAESKITQIFDQSTGCPQCGMSYSPTLPNGPCARCDLDSFMEARKEYKAANPEPTHNLTPPRAPSPQGDSAPRGWVVDRGKAVVKKTPAKAEPVNADVDIRNVGLDTEAKMSARLIQTPIGEDFIYLRNLGWMRWNGARWSSSNSEEVIEAIRVHITGIYDRAYTARDPSWEKLARQYMSRNKLANLEALLRGQLLREPQILDSHPELLNTPDGVVDLRTGELASHSRDLYLTKITEVGYRPGAMDTDWNQALLAIPEKVRDWFQVNMGQSLTGYTCTEDRMFFAQGGGANGKTTIMSVAGKAVGDYFVLVHDKVIMGEPGPESLALRGARFALIEELPEERHLNLAALKKLIGTEVIAARPLYKDTLEFRPTHTLWVSTNFRPAIKETDHGSWRRITLVLFPYRYIRPGQPLEGPSDRTGDPMLKVRLMRSRESQEAALAWMVAGAVKWFQAGRRSVEDPEPVAIATREWRKESDQIMAFYEDHLEQCLDCHVLGTELHEEFNSWLKSRSQSPWSPQLFYSRLLDHPEVGMSKLAKKKIKKTATNDPSRPCLSTSWLMAEAREKGTPDSYQGISGIRFRCN